MYEAEATLKVTQGDGKWCCLVNHILHHFKVITTCLAICDSGQPMALNSPHYDS